MTNHASKLHLSYLLLRLLNTIPMELKSSELKFLLRLLKYSPDYRTPISQIKLGKSKNPTPERNKACISLCSKGFVEYIEEIYRYQTTAAGKTLLKSDASTLPILVGPNELALLKVATTKAVIPSTANKVPAGDRQQLLNQLKERGLITVSKSQIKDVWLTPKGIQYLLSDCIPSGEANLTFSILGDYLTFLRQFLGQKGAAVATFQELPNTKSASNKDSSLTPDAVLDAIRQLDQQLDADNFLPIFHLREKLQTSHSREALDRLLYDLQSQDLIELSTLQDVSNYSETEVAAGIPQNIGGALFYISVTK